MAAGWRGRALLDPSGGLTAWRGSGRHALTLERVLAGHCSGWPAGSGEGGRRGCRHRSPRTPWSSSWTRDSAWRTSRSDCRLASLGPGPPRGQTRGHGRPPALVLQLLTACSTWPALPAEAPGPAPARARCCLRPLPARRVVRGQCMGHGHLLQTETMLSRPMALDPSHRCRPPLERPTAGMHATVRPRSRLRPIGVFIPPPFIPQHSGEDTMEEVHRRRRALLRAHLPRLRNRPPPDPDPGAGRLARPDGPGSHRWWRSASPARYTDGTSSTVPCRGRPGGGAGGAEYRVNAPDPRDGHLGLSHQAHT